MLTEGQRPRGEQTGVDPVVAARATFNKELLGREYVQGASAGLVGRLTDFQTALLRSKPNLSTAFSELQLMAGQGAVRAEIFGDTEAAERLRGMQEGYRLTLENLTAQPVRGVRYSEPTQTGNLPSMTSGKGMSESAAAQPPDATSPSQPRRRGRQPRNPQTPPTS